MLLDGACPGLRKMPVADLSQMIEGHARPYHRRRLLIYKKGVSVLGSENLTNISSRWLESYDIV